VTFFSIRRLRDEHALLDQELAVARRTEPLDLEHIATLKARKLAVKNRIAALETKRETAPCSDSSGRRQVMSRDAGDFAEASSLGRRYRDGGLPGSDRIGLGSAGRAGREPRAGSSCKSTPGRNSA